MTFHQGTLSSVWCSPRTRLEGYQSRWDLDRMRRRWRNWSEAVEGSVGRRIRSGLVWPREISTGWDAGCVGNPVVSCYVGDEEERWIMYYTGLPRDASFNDLPASFPLTGITGLVTSSDGMHWIRSPIDQEFLETPDNIVLKENTTEWWAFDTMSVAVSDVQMIFSPNVNATDGVYWMFYSGISKEKTSQGRRSIVMRPGLAMSQDGRHWARIEGQHYSGALFEIGEEGEWDAAFIAQPCILNCGSRDLRMYYHSLDLRDGKYKIGLAVSENGLKWKKRGVLFEGGSRYDFDAGGVAASCVVYDPDNDQFAMFYEAIDRNERRSIGLAVSKDGLSNWVAHDQSVLLPSDRSDAWDAGSVGSPCAVSMAQGSWRLYYSGASKETTDWEGIGLALSRKGRRFKGIQAEFQRIELG